MFNQQIWATEIWNVCNIFLLSYVFYNKHHVDITLFILAKVYDDTMFLFNSFV